MPKIYPYVSKLGWLLILTLVVAACGQQAGIVQVNALNQSALQQPTQTFTFTPSSTFTPSPLPPTPTQTPLPQATAIPATPNGGSVPTEVPLLEPTAPPPPEISAEPPAESIPQSGRLELGETRENEILQAGEVHRYTFFGTAEDVVNIVVNVDPENAGTLDPYLELQGPSGDIIADNDNFLDFAPDALIQAFEVPTTGVYTIYVQAVDEFGTGGYLLTVDTQPLTLRDVERGAAVRGEPNEELLETYGAREVWTIELDEADVVSVSVEGLDDGLDVMVELVAPNDEDSWFDNDSGAETDAYLDSIIAPESGVYTIYIAARNNESVGAYRLWWAVLSDIPTATPLPPTATLPPTPIPPSDTIEGSVTFGETFAIIITAESGQTVNIVVQGVAGFDPVLRVSDTAGNILAEVDDVGDSRDPRTRFDAETSGFLIVEVFGFEGAAGNFILSYIIQ